MAASWLSVIGAALAAACVEVARAGCTFGEHVVCFTGKLRPRAEGGVAATVPGPAQGAFMWVVSLQRPGGLGGWGGGVFLFLILQRWKQAQRS